EEILSKAYDSNERQLKIVSDLLKVARVDAGKVILRETETDISQLVADVVLEESGIAKERGQEIIFEPATEETVAWVDRDTIRMVFENLIDNASKYSEAGTSIQVNVKSRGNAVQVEIRDEGVGIDQKDSVRLFEKFSRIHNPLSTQAGGSGLGLYWAKKVVDLHNGTIEVESEVGKGTTFTVSLPKGINKGSVVK